MTALYMDGFDHYGVLPSGTTSPDGVNRRTALNMLDGNWAQVDTAGVNNGGFMVSVPVWGQPRTGVGCLTFKPQAGALLARKVLNSTQTKLFVSFGFAVDVLPAGQWGQTIIDFRNNANTVLYSVGMNASGQVQLWNGPQTSLNAITNGPVVRSQTWHYFEMEINLVDGAFILRVDDAAGTGTAAINATIATSGSVLGVGFGQYTAVGSPVQSLSMYWDDLFIRNASGSINNGFLGDQRIATLFTIADTTSAGWTPSYYKEFGAGVLSLATVSPNFPTPANQTACVTTPGVTGLDIGAANFTLETMVRWDQLPASGAYSTVFSRWDSAANHRSYRLILGGSAFNNSSLQFDTSTDGTSSTLQTPVSYPWAPNLNQWYHLALVRSSGNLLLFVDGTQLGVPVADSRTYFGSGAEVFAIGAEVQGTSTVVANTNVAGRLDETRFTNGVARYTGPFAPPVAAFPRGSGSDASWSSVALLSGYDSGIFDESSFSRVLTARNGAVQFTPNDGPLVGAYSTVNKATPDDNTFISASLTSATGVLSMTTQPAINNTVTVGTTDGTTAAVYTFKGTASSAFDVLIDTTAQNTLINLLNAINAGAGSGTKYGTGTTVNWDVNAVQLPVGQIQVVANTAGTAGNSVATDSTGVAAVWSNTTLTGGQDIPDPSNFKFQRPPPETTIISALQTTVRALKTDSGAGSIQTALIAPLGGTAAGAVHALAISPDYYNDIIETDPDTSGALSPTTIINGEFQINRTA